MKIFFELFSIQFYVLYLIAVIISYGFGKYAINYSKIKQFSFKFDFLIIEDSFFFKSLFGFNIAVGLFFSWWYSLLLFLLMYPVSIIILAFLERSFSSYHPFWYTAKIVSFFIDIWLFVVIFQSFTYSKTIFGFKVTLFIIVLLMNIPKILITLLLITSGGIQLVKNAINQLRDREN